MSTTVYFHLGKADRVVEFAPDRFFYYGAIDSFQISVGGYSFALKDSGSARVEVSGGSTNRVIFETLNAESVDFGGASFFDDRPLSSLGLSFYDVVSSRSNGTSLIPELHDLAAASDVRFRAISRDQTTQDDLTASAVAVSVATVPLPPSVLLSAMALGILSALHRFKAPAASTASRSRQVTA